LYKNWTFGNMSQFFSPYMDEIVRSLLEIILKDLDLIWHNLICSFYGKFSEVNGISASFYKKRNKLKEMDLIYVCCEN
jgi:hypothetical protein